MKVIGKSARAFQLQPPANLICVIFNRLASNNRTRVVWFKNYHQQFLLNHVDEKQQMVWCLNLTLFIGVVVQDKGKNFRTVVVGAIKV